MSSGSPSTNILDHIVHLTPPDSLSETISDFETLGFTVLKGGSHSDGITSNALIILPDGVYLELIFFNKPNPPPTHRWGTRRLGWVDSANLGTDHHLENVINERFQKETGSSDLLYLPGQDGGRITPSGKELKWRVTFSDSAKRAGELPFFCEDLTPREWRVPTSPISNTIHANKVQGVAYLKYLTPPSNFQSFSSQIGAAIGLPPLVSEDVPTRITHTWKLSTPFKPNQTTDFILVSSDPSNEEEVARGSGLYEVGFWVTDSDTKQEADSKWGRIVYLPLP